ncbi:hypothetical protein DY468_00400 [Rhodopseudomonas sp. BR0M22]|nr:hypothetical protein [Rhodopseudomonas sp. BR0M22]
MDADRQYHFANLVNELEAACAIYFDDIFFGESRRLLKHYLLDVFDRIDKSQEARALLQPVLANKNTFASIREFLRHHGKKHDAFVKAA